MFIAEARIYDIRGYLGTPNHSGFRQCTPIDVNSKVVGYVSNRHHKVKPHTPRNAATIKLGLTNIHGVYLLEKHNPDRIREELDKLNQKN